MKFEPHDYQKTAIKWLLSHSEAALFLDPGLGKTSIALTALKALGKRALVIAPLRPAYSVWSHAGEVGKWSDFCGLKVSLLHGKEKEQRARESADLYVINFDGIPWAMEGGILDIIKPEVLVIDELSKLKHTNTRRFKALKPHLGKFKKRWGLTGSPASNGLLDLFGQCYALDLGKALGKFITHYRHQYFMPTGYGGYQWTLKHGAEKEIYKAIDPLALSMKAEDHLDLPDLVERNVWVNLPDAATKTYKELHDDLITQIQGNIITAGTVAVASMKCRQVASGGLYDEKRNMLHVHDAKTEALTDLVDELQGKQLLIAYEFDHDLFRIRQALGDVPAINGKCPPSIASKLEAEWNAGKLPILAGHPAAMGHGLNLQASGSHVAWYSLTWDFELYDQLIRRVWRQGQKRRVIVHRILARKTVDESVVKALGSKKRNQDALFEALKCS